MLDNLESTWRGPPSRSRRLPLELHLAQNAQPRIGVPEVAVPDRGGKGWMGAIASTARSMAHTA